MTPIVLGLPKGSLQDATFNMMRKAGFNLAAGPRSYVPACDDPQLRCRLLRAQEISRYVGLGVLDAGITGYDWICETGADVQEVAELLYAKQGLRPVRWVVAVPDDSPIREVGDLQGRRIATEAVGLTRRYLAARGIQAEVEFSWGATEVKAPELVDAIVELTETGASLRANNLRILDTVLESTTRLIANRRSWADEGKRAKIEQLAMLLKGALAAETRVLLKMNVPAERLDAVTALLPALHAPTVNALNAAGWHAVETVVEERMVRDLLPTLRQAGARGIIELPLNKVIP
jgi:ATP phosphoribosyltransferase